METRSKKCTICLRSIANINRNTANCNAKHPFHKKCLNEWKKRSNKCPVCRGGGGTGGGVVRTRSNASNSSMNSVTYTAMVNAIVQANIARFNMENQIEQNRIRLQNRAAPNRSGHAAANAEINRMWMNAGHRNLNAFMRNISNNRLTRNMNTYSSRYRHAMNNPFFREKIRRMRMGHY